MLLRRGVVAALAPLVILVAGPVQAQAAPVGPKEPKCLKIVVTGWRVAVRETPVPNGKTMKILTRGSVAHACAVFSGGPVSEYTKCSRKATFWYALQRPGEPTVTAKNVDGRRISGNGFFPVTCAIPVP